MKITTSTTIRLICLTAIAFAGLQAADSDAEYRWRILPNLGGHDSVNLTLTRRVTAGFSTTSNTVPLSSLHGLEPGDLWGGTVSFHIRRDAGTLHCKGSFVVGVGSGTVKFEPDAHFTAELKALGISFDEEQLPELVFEDIRLTTIRDLRAACSCVRTMEDVLNLNHHGVDSRYLHQAAQFSSNTLDIEDITSMKDHGVQPSLLEALKSAGYQLPTHAIIELHDHGIDASFLRGLAPQYRNDRTAQNLIALHDHGVTPEFVRKLRESGVNPSTNEIIELHDHGVDTQLLRAAKDTGFETTPGAVIQLHDHGVNPDYVRAMQAAVPSKLTVEELIELHDHGVSTEFARQVGESRFVVKDPRQLIQLHEHGVPVDLIAQAVRTHNGMLTTDEAIQLHEHGVDAGFLRSFDEAGYSNATVRELIDLHEHGVTADYAHHLKTEGFGVLPVNKLIQMKDHGV